MIKNLTVKLKINTGDVDIDDLELFKMVWQKLPPYTILDNWMVVESVELDSDDK